jgi:hypothetical protein
VRWVGRGKRQERRFSEELPVECETDVTVLEAACSGREERKGMGVFSFWL